MIPLGRLSIIIRHLQHLFRHPETHSAVERQLELVIKLLLLTAACISMLWLFMSQGRREEAKL